VPPKIELLVVDVASLLLAPNNEAAAVVGMVVLDPPKIELAGVSVAAPKAKAGVASASLLFSGTFSPKPKLPLLAAPPKIELEAESTFVPGDVVAEPPPPMGVEAAPPPKMEPAVVVVVGVGVGVVVVATAAVATAAAFSSFVGVSKEKVGVSDRVGRAAFGLSACAGEKV
jgi:hypothetical protein